MHVTLYLGEEGTDQLGSFLLVALLCDVTCQRQTKAVESAEMDTQEPPIMVGYVTHLTRTRWDSLAVSARSRAHALTVKPADCSEWRHKQRYNQQNPTRAITQKPTRVWGFQEENAGKVSDIAGGVFDNTQHLDSSDSRRMKTHLGRGTLEQPLTLKLLQTCQTRNTDVQAADLTKPSQTYIRVVN